MRGRVGASMLATAVVAGCVFLAAPPALGLDLGDLLDESVDDVTDGLDEIVGGNPVTEIVDDTTDELTDVVDDTTEPILTTTTTTTSTTTTTTTTVSTASTTTPSPTRATGPTSTTTTTTVTTAQSAGDDTDRAVVVPSPQDPDPDGPAGDGPVADPVPGLAVVDSFTSSESGRILFAVEPTAATALYDRLVAWLDGPDSFVAALAGPLLALLVLLRALLSAGSGLVAPVALLAVYAVWAAVRWRRGGATLVSAGT